MISPNDLWQQTQIAANKSGLDASKFTAVHRTVTDAIAAHLATTQTQPRKRFARFFKQSPPTINPVAPIILCGEPGTGKTTFLYVLDTLLRSELGLPDHITPMMTKRGDEFAVHKRFYCGSQLSLLSVKKWAELLHFYYWDKVAHSFDAQARAEFIDGKIRPMRVIFADEVELTGYAPTIPTLVKHGILLIGTSNQYDFPQLENEQTPPIILRVAGDDMRLGDPQDAVVLPTDALWTLFAALDKESIHRIASLPYQYAHHDGEVVIKLDLADAISAPFLESEWGHFLQNVYQQATHFATIQPHIPLTLLLDRFSLDVLQRDFNGVIRFVYLFDAIEQLGVGVLVRNEVDPPQLSQESIANMKQVIENAEGVSAEIKHKTTVGLGRWASRLGQAAYRAKQERLSSEESLS